MCGIVGLFLKNPKFKPELGNHLGEMLVKMSDRGPDSAGLAVYANESNLKMKFSIRFYCQSVQDELVSHLKKKLKNDFDIAPRGSHWILTILKEDYNCVSKIISNLCVPPRIMSEGESIEIYKEVGSPVDFVKNFLIDNFAGTHGIGHTRMATESAVSTMGAHPFSTGFDQCLVHNGSLSNHNNIRRKLLTEGIECETENDSEVAASYLSAKMTSGMDLHSALNQSLSDLDGFFTFLVGTQGGFAVLRDRIACKPAVLAETDDYVAFGSEYRALTSLPSIQSAKVWEPEPGKVYIWEHDDESI